jgi:hypothetical protein
MKVCRCPRCGVVHEAVSASALIGLDETLARPRIHYRVCSLAGEHFTPLPNGPDLRPNKPGYPMEAVLQLREPSR